MKKTLSACVLAIAFAALGADRASAQTDTFMLVPGIPGGSVNESHKNWIDVLSITQTLEEAARKRSSCDIHVGKSLDVAGPLLWLAAVTGQVFPEIKVEVVKAGGDKPFLLYEIKLANARISTIATGVSFGFNSENLSLVADTATLTVFTQKPDGSTGGSVTATVSCK